MSENNLNVKCGDRVYFKAEFQDAGDAERVFLAIEDDDGESVAVVCASSSLPIQPCEFVRLSTIERVERKGAN